MKLSARYIRKRYGEREVVRGINLDISSGEIVGLLGPNGAGKTTTFYSLAGFVRPEQGQILIDEEDVTQLPMFARARRGLGYLAQEPTVFRGLTVEQNLRAILERTLPSTLEQMRRGSESASFVPLRALKASTSSASISVMFCPGRRRLP